MVSIIIDRRLYTIKPPDYLLDIAEEHFGKALVPTIDEEHEVEVSFDGPDAAKNAKLFRFHLDYCFLTPVPPASSSEAAA